MSSWAAKMHRRAATFGNVVTSCGQPTTGPYPRRLEKVKFGVPLEQVCKNDIPGPLLVLILKLNKEAPYRKDVFRAPGNQGSMKKLIHFLTTGRLINMDNFSVYTIASVLKKFLRKIPGGVFGREIEHSFFEIIQLKSNEAQEQRNNIHRIITSLPVYTQRLLVLLFGTFRVISANSERAATGMTSEALGVSVAPSFFHTCVSDGKTAKMEDVIRYKAEVDVATRVMKHLIDEFSSSDLFGRENYEFYARVTGRVLRIQGEWICSFQYPITTSATSKFGNHYQFRALEQYLLANCECSSSNNIQSSPTTTTTNNPITTTSSQTTTTTTATKSSNSLGMIAEHTLLESCTRLSISLEQNGFFQGQNTSRSSSASFTSSKLCYSGQHMTLEELRVVNHYAESTRSLSYLPQVHERQTERMRTRSQWFLAPSPPPLPQECSSCGGSLDLQDIGDLCTNATLIRRSSSGTIVGVMGLSTSAESIQKRPSLRRSNSRNKQSYLHRSTSRRNKIVHSRSNSFKGRSERKPSTSRSGSVKLKNISPHSCSFQADLCSSCCMKNNEQQQQISSHSVDNANAAASTAVSPTTANKKNKNLETIHVTLTYKPIN